MASLEEKRRDAAGLMELLPWPVFRRGLTIGLRTNEKDISSVMKSASVEKSVSAESSSVVSSEALPHLFSLMKPVDKVAAWHCIHASVQVIRVKKGDSAQPIIVKKDKDSSAEHLLVIVDEGATGTIIEINASAVRLRTEGAELVLGRGSSLEYVVVQDHGIRTESFGFRSARIADDASLSIVSCVFGGRLAREDWRILQEGRHSNHRQAVMFFGSEDQELDISVDVEQLGKQTVSEILAQGCVAGNAVGIVQGRIHIGRDASDASGFESSDILVLESSAHGNAIPMLEIDNPDVRCGHAAKVGHVDEAKLFYLQSRGIMKEEAKKLLIEGFFLPLMQKLSDPLLKESIVAMIDRKLQGMRGR